MFHERTIGPAETYCNEAYLQKNSPWPFSWGTNDHVKNFLRLNSIDTQELKQYTEMTAFTN